MKARKRRKIVALLLPLCMLVTLVMSRTNVISARAEEDPPVTKVGYWIDNTDYDAAPGSVEVTYANGDEPDTATDPETGEEYAYFAAESSLKVAVWVVNGDREPIPPEQVELEIEFKSGADKSFLDFERLPEGSINYNEDTNLLECTFDLPAGIDLFCVRVFWEGRGLQGGSGSSKILEAATQYIYAYTSAYDFNGDDKVMDKADPEQANYTDDLRYALASELYRKFIWGGQYGELNFLGTPHNDFDYWHNKPVIDQVYEQIEMEPAGTITAKDAAGESVMLDRYKATVVWGIDEKTREPLVSELYVYDLPDEQAPEGGVFFNHVLICTDFDKATGTGDTFYLRDIRNDRENFSDYETDEYDTDGDNGIVIYDSGANAVIGGYDSVSDIISQSENMTSITQSIYPENMTIFDQSYTVHVRFMNPEATYIAVHSEGEALRYDGMGLNGFAGDSICETGDDVTTAVYVGDTKVVLSPVLADGLTTSDIADVRLKDAKQAAGVNIDKSDLTSIEVEFLSNFYDTVTFVIEYNDGTENEITIVRQGLIIRYHFVDGNDDNENMNYDCWGPGNEFKGPNYTYDYQAGEQIMIFATYYHPSNYATLSGDDSLNLVVTYADGTTEVITADNEEHNYHGYAEGSAYGSVDTTSFIIDFIPVTENNEAQNYKGGFNALVVNGGYDDPDTFGGAQLGSGKGVYWNGDLKFN